VDRKIEEIIAAICGWAGKAGEAGDCAELLLWTLRLRETDPGEVQEVQEERDCHRAVLSAT
jgi:hypothetical protein